MPKVGDEFQSSEVEVGSLAGEDSRGCPFRVGLLLPVAPRTRLP